MNIVRVQCYEGRLDDDEQPWDWCFGTGVWGLLDTFPIFCHRPKNPQWQRSLWQGKYKGHITKVQVVANRSGLPRFWSGPHVGTISDIKLWRRHGCPMGPDEALAADLAYIGNEELITPYKRAPGRDLDQKQKDYNTIHR